MFLIPHIGTIIWLTLIFSILLYILAKFAWNPMIKAIADREESIKSALDSAKEAELKIASIQTTQEELIALAKIKKEEIIKEGNDQRERIIALAKEKAQAEADKIIDDAKKKISIERESALSEIKNQITSLSIEIASKVVHADMEDKKRHEKLVAELIQEVDLN